MNCATPDFGRIGQYYAYVDVQGRCTTYHTFFFSFSGVI